MTNAHLDRADAPPGWARIVIASAITGWLLGSAAAEWRLLRDDATFLEEVKAYPTGRWLRTRWWPHGGAILGVQDGVVWSHGD